MLNHLLSMQRKVKFERHASQVVFDPASCDFVVTWSKCGIKDEERIAGRKDPLVWIPSVDAIATLYDRGRIPHDQAVYAAMAIGRAWAAGDREMLDTESAKKAAELVHDLSTMCVNASSPAVTRDVCQAIRHLLDEMAAVRFANIDEDMLDGNVVASLEKSVNECFSIEGFCSWPPSSMRRRLLYCLNRRERTPVAYTLIALLFDVGACPLLSLSDRRALRMQAIRESRIGICMDAISVTGFFRFALSRMRAAKLEGRSTVGVRLTQQQLVDSLPMTGEGMEEKKEEKKEQESEEMER